MSKKDWTGERLETYIFNENMAEHLHRYAIARNLAAGKVVLDIACGEGYGSHLLADVAKQVFGVDVDAGTIAHATGKYQKPNLSFSVGNAAKIPLADHTVDLVVSYETIEHHDQHEAMLSEIKRVLKPGGLLIISSPDKKYYTDETGFENIYHVKELYEHEFKALIGRYFSNCQHFNQRFITGSYLEAATQQDKADFYRGDYTHIETSKFTPVYNLIIATDQAELPLAKSSFFYAMSNEGEIRQEVLTALRNTATWKLGSFLLYPFSLAKRLFKRGS